MLIRKEGLETMQCDLRKNQTINQIRAENSFCGHLMLVVYLCLKQLEIGAKCCLGINSVMATKDVIQRITVQGTVSSGDQVRYKKKQPTGLHGFKPRERWSKPRQWK